MKTLYLSCAILVVVCFGCSGAKPTITREDAQEKESLPPSIEQVQAPNRPAVPPKKPPLAPPVEPQVQPPVKMEVQPIDDCKKDTAALSPIPPQYGEPIRGSSGTVTYCLESSGSFEATVTLKGLEKSHGYALTLNGEVGRLGNKELIKAGKENNGEGVVDRPITPTDPNGCWKGKFPHVLLDRGVYNVKFFVKNRDKDGWPIVLYNDNLSFTVTK